MKKRGRHLVDQHLEGISRIALENYQEIIREYVRGRHGVYALYKNNHPQPNLLKSIQPSI